MASTKLYDLAVKTGTYTNSHGEEKGRYENVGAVLRGDKGQFLMLKRTFNPAGCPGDRDTVLISCFEPSQRASGGGQAPQQQGQRADLDDEVPFAPEVRA